jgi:hypothetical protein
MVTAAIPALIVGMFAMSSVAAHGSDGKVDLCHFADHKFVKITVAESAEPAHLRGGDTKTDEYGDCDGDGEHHDGDDDDQGGDHDGHDGHGGEHGEHGDHGGGDSDHGGSGEHGNGDADD